MERKIEDTLEKYFERLQDLTSPEDRIMSSIIEKEVKYFVLEFRKHLVELRSECNLQLKIALGDTLEKYDKTFGNCKEES